MWQLNPELSWVSSGSQAATSVSRSSQAAQETLWRRGRLFPFSTVRTWAGDGSSHLCTSYLARVTAIWQELPPVPPPLRPFLHPGMPSCSARKRRDARKRCSQWFPPCTATSRWHGAVISSVVTNFQQYWLTASTGGALWHFGNTSADGILIPPALRDSQLTPALPVIFVFHTDLDDFLLLLGLCLLIGFGIVLYCI